MSHKEGVGAEHPRTHIYIITPIILFIILILLDSVIFNFSTFLQKYIPFILRISICIFFFIWAVVFFILSHRAVFTEESKEKKLIKTGIYAYFRHPMYISMPLIFIAFILLTFSIISIIPLIIYILLLRSVMNFEEKELEKIFGQEYLNYKEKVLRWIPRLISAK
ncbi:MAG TPA: isoprenylcysteine carboxylmethyltransferase family protein, partial [Candidatus Lokiarchaeia archaeon]